MAIRYLSGINVDSNTLFVDDANNRVGIGTASPTQALDVTGRAYISSGASIGTTSTAGTGLTVNGSTVLLSFVEIQQGNLLYLYSSGNTYYSQIYQSGQNLILSPYSNVGIGTTSPAVKFVVSNAGASGFEVDPSGGVGGGPVLQAYNRSTSAYMAQSYYALSHTFNVGSGGSTRAVDITSSGNVGIGTTSPNGALHVASSPQTRVVIENTGNDANGAGLIMTVRSSGTIVGNGGIYVDNSNNLILYNGGVYAGNERVRINNSGYVGINTIAPSSFLTVSPGGSGNAATFTSTANAINNYVGITLNAVTVSGVEWYGSEIRNINTGGTPGFLNPRLGFFTQNASTYLPADRTEKMSILGNGNVGIGTTSPSQKLAVVGTSDIVSYSNGTTTGYLYSDANGVGLFNGTTGSGTGIYARTSNILDFYYGSSIGIRLSSTGNVGIGTTSPTGKLDVVPTSQNGINIARAGGYPSIYGSNSLVFETDDVFYFGVYTPRVFSVNSDFYITTAGRVGIGIGTPTTKLEVVGSDENILKLKNTGGQPALVRFNDTSTSADPYIGSYGNALAFGIYGVGESIRIDSSRNVGIGTTSPGYKLDVAGTSRSDLHIFRSNQSAPTADAFIFRPADNTIALGTANSERMRISSAGALKLNAYGSGSNTGTATQRLAVDASGNVIEIPIGSGPVDGNGTANYVTKWSDADTITNSIIYDNGTNVGIGESSPSYKLHVGGTFRASSDSSIGGNVIIGGTSAPSTTWTGVGRDRKSVV